MKKSKISRRLKSSLHKPVFSNQWKISVRLKDWSLFSIKPQLLVDSKCTNRHPRFKIKGVNLVLTLEFSIMPFSTFAH